MQTKKSLYSTNNEETIWHKMGLFVDEVWIVCIFMWVSNKELFLWVCFAATVVDHRNLNNNSDTINENENEIVNSCVQGGLLVAVV